MVYGACTCPSGANSPGQISLSYSNMVPVEMQSYTGVYVTVGSLG